MFDQRSLKMRGDQSEEEDVFEMTKDGTVRQRNGRVRGVYTLSAEADTPDPRQHRRIGPMKGA